MTLNDVSEKKKLNKNKIQIVCWMNKTKQEDSTAILFFQFSTENANTCHATEKQKKKQKLSNTNLFSSNRNCEKIKRKQNEK